MKFTVSNEQEKVLNTSRAYYNLHGKQPTLSYLQTKLGYKHASAVQHHIVSLRKKGLLEFNLNPGKTRDIALVGNIACGPAMLAEENIDTYIPYPESQLRSNSQYFFLRASGDSMDQAGVDDGDYLLIRQSQDVSRKDKVIVLIGDEATCKYLRYEDGLPTLIPASSNKHHKKRILLEDFSVLGLVQDVVKPKRRATHA